MAESISYIVQGFAETLRKTLDGQVIDTKNRLKGDVGIQPAVSCRKCGLFARVSPNWSGVAESVILVILDAEEFFGDELIIIKSRTRCPGSTGTIVVEVVIEISGKMNELQNK